jgi:adenosylmethionine-8-amino-7-oxononanoate aminotransferase
MQKIVERVRNASVGSNVSPSEFVHKVKEACLREDVAFDNDLFEEILSKT